jgi:squalene-associated FAD-dependent desaturase
LHEAAVALGGRARAVVRDGLPLDNGQHLLLGAYTQTLAFAAAIRDASTPSAWTIEPLVLRPFARSQRNRLSLTTRHAPASLALASALVRARGLSLAARAATVRWFLTQRRRNFRCDTAQNVADLCADAPAVVRDDLWHPLCLAALNTPPPRASAQVFLNVLRETFGAGPGATSIVMPREGLAEAIPEAAARWLVARGHLVRRSTRTRVRRVDDDGVLLDVAEQPMHADGVIVAVGPHQLASIFMDLECADASIADALAKVARFDYEPITTIYLGYAVPLPLPRGLLRLDDAPGQWIFDRGDVLERAATSATRPPMRALVSVVISARGAHSTLDHAALAAAADAQLRRLATNLPPLVWSQVIEEKRATYACVPGLERPACGALTDRVYLAGDYTYETFPATLEAAVRSGFIAARAALGVS